MEEWQRMKARRDRAAPWDSARGNWKTTSTQQILRDIPQGIIPKLREDTGEHHHEGDGCRSGDKPQKDIRTKQR
jgi:hypothetical protein